MRSCDTPRDRLVPTVDVSRLSPSAYLVCGQACSPVIQANAALSQQLHHARAGHRFGYGADGEDVLGGRGDVILQLGVAETFAVDHRCGPQFFAQAVPGLYLTEAAQVTGEVLYVDGGQHVGKW
jgi:hypothetical protein